MKQFDSILVANRGEIAVRIIRSAQGRGYRSIAVYSEADADAPHVKLADEAVLIGPAPVKDSYLDPERILAAARKTGAEAIHPGYGFLSENAEFAKACQEAGLVFVGPTPESIEIMGNKAAAKRHMIEAGVPCIPGYEGVDQSDKALLAVAHDIGVPIMVKAAAGGGGRGMRLVTEMDAMSDALASARSEAKNAFGSDELILEKAVMQPRHVEIQVFGDTHGNVIHLGERDCSVQRRHQKVVEEAPCPVVDAELREAMGAAAVDAARSINYVGAGTVEFLLDAEGKFYFLEMNTRLQVEHPVTEMVTGQDLVALQFKVAEGYPLPITQDDVRLNGHAIEVRLYAEDTTNDFLPASGKVHAWQPPTGEGVRVDCGLEQGLEISPYYDPMVAKIITWGEDRDIARRRLVRALQKTTVLGLQTNKEFLVSVLQNDAFAQGEATTAFIDENYNKETLNGSPASAEMTAVAAVLQYRQARIHAEGKACTSPFELSGWASSSKMPTRFQYGEEEVAEVAVHGTGKGLYKVEIDDRQVEFELIGQGNTELCLKVDQVQKKAQYAYLGYGEVAVQLDGVSRSFLNNYAFTKGDENAAGGGTVAAPMHGNLLKIFVSAGDEVKQGQPLVVMEAMKMEHQLKAQIDGKVHAIHAVVGNQVAAGSVLIEITELAN